jgi:hypothetical protein
MKKTPAANCGRLFFCSRLAELSTATESEGCHGHQAEQPAGRFGDRGDSIGSLEFVRIPKNKVTTIDGTVMVKVTVTPSRR